MENNREVFKKVQRVEAMDNCHTVMKTALLAIEHVLSLHIRCARIHTSCTGIVEAIKNYPACRFGLITLCGEFKSLADKLDGCVVKKCSKEQVKNARALAVNFSRSC